MWIILSLSAALCFTGIFIAFKYLENSGVSSIVTLTYLFFFSACIGVLHAKFSAASFFTTKSVILIFIVSAILSYFGNLMQIKAISLAPNPGYATAVVSSNAVLLTIASVYFFSSDFTWLKAFGVLLCVIGVSLMSL